MKQQNWALITGATSGIGAAFAGLLAGRGISLLLTGRRERELSEFAETLKTRHSIQVETVIGDLSKNSTIENIISAAEKHAPLAYLVNNAGFGAENGFFDESYGSQEQMVKVHIEAVVRITHALAPHIHKPGDRRQGPGGIIFVSSIASFFSSPRSVLYCSTKAFINSFAKSIAVALFPRGIPVQALCPGFTRTDFHNKLSIPDAELKNKGIVRWMSPRKVAAISLRKLRIGKIIVIPGILNKLIVFISGIIPQWIYLPAASRKGKLFVSDKNEGASIE